jgi:hypothetical protein
MNEDYLWDRSGEPDPAVRELEEVLGTLRYQPTPLRLPATSQIRPPRRQAAWLAVAAAIVLVVLAVGVWVRIKRSAPSVNPEVVQKTDTGNGQDEGSRVTVPSPSPESGPQPKVEPDRSAGNKIPHRRSTSHGPAWARNRRPAIKSEAREEISAAEMQAALETKEKLMQALRLASAKLNLAQRKTQGIPSPANIRNQHKVG